MIAFEPEIDFCRELLDKLLIPPYQGDMVEWASGNLKIPSSQRYPIFIPTESPWILEPMRALTDPKVSRVDIRMPAGAAKSLIGIIHIMYVIQETPGFYYYVWQTDDDGKDAMEDHIFPTIEANEQLAQRLPVDRSKKRITKIVFPHMSLYCVGANLSAAQSKRVRFLTMEEPHLYAPGMMAAFEKRIEGVKDAKILTLSTGSVLGDESDESFNRGSCEVWQVPCPYCGEYQTMTDSVDRLLSDISNENVSENGEIDWKKVLPTVRYNCECCGKDWANDQEQRHKQAQKGRYLRTNESAPDSHRSFHMEAVSVHYFDWAKILYEKIIASSAAKRGVLEPLKDYIQKRRAMAWEEKPLDVDERLIWDRCKGDYLLEQPFEGEITRFLTVDNQAGRVSKGEGAHRWVTCRAWGPTESRLIYCGRIVTWEEVELLRIRLGVEPNRTLVDVAYDSFAVQEQCIKYGWQGLWGEKTNKRSFPHSDTINGQKVVRQLPFSGPQLGHTSVMKDGSGRQAVYRYWCGNPIKDMWHRMKAGLSEYRWTIAKNTSEEFQKQCSVEFKSMSIEKKTGRKVWTYKIPGGKANHLADCDQMNLVAAIMDPRLRQILWGGMELIEDENQG